MKLPVTVLLCAALLVSPTAAQTTFRANLDGFQEVPPNPGTPGGGYALLTLTQAGTITYDVQAFGFVPTVAHIHKGPVGVSGAIIFPLTQTGPTTYGGVTPVLTPAQQADLRADLYYVNVHSAAFPAGEIRGQVHLSPRAFGARLDGLQETPQSGSAAKGNATMLINDDGTLTYLVTTMGLVAATAAHIHSGAFGSAGPIEIPLAGGPTTWSGTTVAPVTESQIELLQNLGMYVNVHTAAFPGGEIRGQLVSSGVPYGPKSDPPTGVITLSSSGAPTDVGGGGVLTLSITHAKPLATGFMLTTLDDGGALLGGEPYLLDGILFEQWPIKVLPSGDFSISFVMPPLPFTVDIFMQFFALDSAAPNGKFNASNGQRITFQHF